MEYVLMFLFGCLGLLALLGLWYLFGTVRAEMDKYAFRRKYCTSENYTVHHDCPSCQVKLKRQW